MNDYQARIDLLKAHPQYPFTFYNTDMNEYVLASIFWLNILKINHDFFDWKYYEMYLNFDHDSDISIPIIKLYHYEQKKILTISHISKYEEDFDYPYFMIGTGYTEVDITDDEMDEFYELGIGVDLRYDKSLDYALDFIKKFIDENIPLEKMKILIEDFDQKYGLELQRK